jgi:hypothetical protein
VKLRADKSAKPGPQNLSAKLRVQACDEQVCYAPGTLDVSIPLTMQVKRFWIILAGAFALAAVILFLRQDYESIHQCGVGSSLLVSSATELTFKSSIRVNQTETDENLESDEGVV